MYIVERGTGVPVVFLHGFSVDHRIMLPLDPAFAGGAWRRLYVDMPGFGHSPRGDVSSTDELVEAVDSGLTDLLGGESFVLVGNSYGGMVSRIIAGRRPQQVIGLATIFGLVVPDLAARDVPAHVVRRSDPSAVALAGTTDYTDLAVIQSPQTAQGFLDYIQPGLQAADPEAVELLSAAYAPTIEPGPYAGPSLFVTGRQDSVVGYRDTWRTLEQYPAATFAVLDGVGHNGHLEAPEAVHALLRDWLDRVGSFTRLRESPMC